MEGREAEDAVEGREEGAGLATVVVLLRNGDADAVDFPCVDACERAEGAGAADFPLVAFDGAEEGLDWRDEKDEVDEGAEEGLGVFVFRGEVAEDGAFLLAGGFFVVAAGFAGADLVVADLADGCSYQ